VEGPCPEAPLRCDDGARARYRETFGYDDDIVAPEDAMRPPQLARGHYAFVARARDADCRVIATGCVEVDLPAASALVTLETEAGVSADCCGATCVDGVCPTGDTGPACVDDDDDPCTVVGCDATGACLMETLADGVRCVGEEVGPCTESVCRSGACVAVPFDEGRECAPGPVGGCEHSICTGGACVVAPLDEGRECAQGPVGGCGHSVCTGGVCTPASLPDGTPCTGSEGACLGAPGCSGGVCVTPTLPDGTDCAGADTACSIATCAGGACVGARPRPGAEGTACPAPDLNPCRSAVCWGTVCAELVPEPDATRCAGDDRHRCCNATCVDIYTDRANCGGCGLACGAGRACRNTGGPRLTACDCAMGIECPNGPMYSDCAGSMPGHCVCTTGMACAPGQSCEDTPRGRSCVYP
jgi:hypothetical protein